MRGSKSDEHKLRMETFIVVRDGDEWRSALRAEVATNKS